MVERAEKPCCLCGQDEDDQLKYGQLFKVDGLIVHHFCMLFSPHLAQNGKDDEGAEGFLSVDIKNEITRASSTSCCYCGRGGATGLCMSMKCKKHYHPSCAVAANGLLQFFGQFKSFCEEHRPRQNVIGRELGESCGICLERTDPEDDHHVLWTPCCRHFFHRSCLQRMAYHFGYFFYCPGCRNKDNVSGFLKHMRHFGIFIPKRDASWELVPNAFGELLERHLVCNVRYCLCSQGRSHQETGPDSPWRLCVCGTCGSAGTHLACSELPETVTSWECPSCTLEPTDPCTATTAARKNSLREFIADRAAAAGIAARAGEASCSSGDSAPPPLTAALSLHEVLSQLDEPEKLIRFTVNPLSGLSVQTRPVSGVRLAAREPGRRPVTFSADELLPEAVVSADDVRQADLRLWSEHHVVSCNDNLPEWSDYTTERHRAATVVRTGFPSPADRSKDESQNAGPSGGHSSQPASVTVARGKPRSLPARRRRVALARSSPVKLRRTTRTESRSDSHGGSEGDGGGYAVISGSDCDDPEMVTGGERAGSTAEGAHIRPLMPLDPAKGERSARSTSTCISQTSCAARVASVKKCGDMRPTKRSMPADTARLASRARLSDGPPVKVPRVNPSLSAASGSRAGCFSAAPIVSDGAASDTDDVMVIDSDDKEAATSDVGTSGVPVNATNASQLTTKSATSQELTPKPETIPPKMVANDYPMRELHMARVALSGYQCPVCDKKQQTLTQATLHYHTHEGKTALFKCKICDAKFSYWHSAHFREKHPHIRSGDIFSNIENNFVEGKRNVLRLMLKKKKLYSEKLLDLLMDTRFKLNGFKPGSNNSPCKPTSPSTSMVENTASATAKEKESKNSEELRRRKSVSSETIRIAKSATSSSSSVTSTAELTSMSSSACAKPTKAKSKSISVKQDAVSAPVPASTSGWTSNMSQGCNDTTVCSDCNFCGIPTVVSRHSYWHTQDAKERRDKLHHHCHLCFYASNVEAHVQIHLMCAHFIEQPPRDISGSRDCNSSAVGMADLPVKQKHYLEQRRYDCPMCDCFFSDKRDFSAHVAQLHVKGTTKATCPFPHCYAENTNLHYKWYHKLAPLENHLCPDCRGTVYHGKEDQHEGGACVRDEALAFECPMPICGFGTRRQDEMDRHLIECHSLWVRGVSGCRKTPYNCPECPAEISVQSPMAYGKFLGHFAEHNRKRKASQENRKDNMATGKQSRVRGESQNQATEKDERGTTKVKVSQNSEERDTTSLEKHDAAPEQGATHPAPRCSARTSEGDAAGYAEKSAEFAERASTRATGQPTRRPADAAPAPPSTVTADGRDGKGRDDTTSGGKGRDDAAGSVSDDDVIVLDDDWTDGDDDVIAADVSPVPRAGPDTMVRQPAAAASSDSANKRTFLPATRDDPGAKGTTKLSLGGNNQTGSIDEPAAAASRAPSERWTQQSVGRFLTDRCQQPVRLAALGLSPAGVHQSTGVPDQCFFCEFVSDSSSEMELHLRTKHKQQVHSFDNFLKSCVTNNRRTKCPVCGIGFRGKWTFFRHIMSHTINIPIASSSP